MRLLFPNLGSRGNAILEFAICLPVLVVALLTVITGGLWFDRYMSVLQLGRNGAAMFSRGMDFSQDANKDLLLLAAADLGITKTSGDGVVYLSRLVQAPPGSGNDGNLVVAERFVIGDTSYKSSVIATPVGSIWPNPDFPLPNGDVKDYQDEASAVATAPSTLATLPLGESMYVTEVYHSAVDLNFGLPVLGKAATLASVIYY